MRGQTGIGALIIFISFVLTAAMASFLITQTTVSTQSKAAAVADQARERIGTTFEVIRVEGLTNNGKIDKYLLYVRLAPGSSPVNLNTTSIAYYTANGRSVYSYGGVKDNESALPDTDEGKFYIVTSLSITKEPSPDNVFEYGEMYVIGIVVNHKVGPSDWWRFTLIPKEGQPLEIYGISPNVFVNEDKNGVIILR